MINQNSNSPLSLFIMMSVGLHIIGASLFVVFAPKIRPVQSVEIILQTYDNIAPTRQIAKISEPIKQITETKKELPVQTPVAQAKPAQPIAPVQTPIAQAPQQQVVQPAVQQVAQAKPVTQAPQQQVVQKPQQQVAQQVAQQPQKQEVQQQPVVQTNKVVAQQPSTNNANTVLTNSNKDLSKELDQLLAQKTTSTSKSTDELADATWSSSPRKTIAFPNIVASIPEQYKARGYGFSVTAKITFSQQGWVSTVELTQGSGDPRIDGIFRSELRKIRVEPIQVSRNDTITKTFKVSVK